LPVPPPRPSQAPTAPPPPPARAQSQAAAPQPLPFSGAYRLVQKGELAQPSQMDDETMRGRMERLGLNPNASTSLLPPPPQRGTAYAVHPHAVVRRAR
jgi:hypothetical protein